jgi:hypothetical protein
MDVKLLLRQLNTRRLLWATGIVVASVGIALIHFTYKATLWDWLQLLIVPAAIAIGGFWLDRMQRERDEASAGRRTQDALLQAYLASMGELLMNNNLSRAYPGQEHDDVWAAGLRVVARARTLTALDGAPPNHKRSVVRFLREAHLIDSERTIVSLAGADLREVDLSRSHLGAINLTGTDLSGADLSGAKLRQEQIDSATGDGNTELPDVLQRPGSWTAKR